MLHPNSYFDHLQELDALQLERALLAPDAVSWRLNVDTGNIIFSAQFPQLFPDSAQSSKSFSLLQQLSPTDKNNFLQVFNSDANDVSELVRVCEINIVPLLHKVRFIGHIVPSSGMRVERIFAGVVEIISASELTNANAEANINLLGKLFSDSNIASIMTDCNGILLQANRAFANLFSLQTRHVLASVGRYNILQDENLLAIPEIMELMHRVYNRNEVHSFDVGYHLKHIEQNSKNKKVIYFRASFLPIQNGVGLTECVLIQLQDMSREKETLQVLLKQQRELQESTASYKAFIANSSEAIWCYDMSPPIPLNAPVAIQTELMMQRARLSQGNKVLLSMLRVESLESILGMGLYDSGSKECVFDVTFFIENNYQMVDHDVVREDRKGRNFYFQISCVGIFENNCLRRVWGTTKDVTARKRYEQRLEYLSLHDTLTGLPNRAAIQREIEQFFARDTHTIGALLFIDLDRFKEINDTLGHQVGDHLLRLIGPRIASELSEIKHTIARMGGDEFAIFLPDIQHQTQTLVVAHRILDALRLEFDLEVFCAEISASIGVALAPIQAADVSTLMRYADVAMYNAKIHMTGIAVYRPDIDPHSPKRLAMMSELGRAIREDQLCLYFQPKVDLFTKLFYGVEALIRWNHPELGFVSPGEFIPIAEATSLIHPLTAWVLEKSIAQCCLWRAQDLQLTVAVNLSARNLLDENMPKLVSRLLQKYNLPAAALEIEITESSIMIDPARALRVLQQLHELGVQLSIDDFGTGYSSLAYLKKLPVQTLKIDIFFIRNMLNDPQDELIVDSTIRLAHSLNLKVVAEGVENEALVERLTAMGCDDAQGFHIGRPMPVAQISTWMENSSWKMSVN
ncbi:MAG: EAL domain-containing protein [Pseudomonadota bacterium]